MGLTLGWMGHVSWYCVLYNVLDGGGGVRSTRTRASGVRR